MFDMGRHGGGSVEATDDVIAALVAAVDLLAARGTDGGDLDGMDAAHEVLDLLAVADRLVTLAARRVPVVEADGWWAVGGARSVTAWLSANARISFGRARRLVGLGRSL